MADIPAPNPSNDDIYSFGFGKDLNKVSPNSLNEKQGLYGATSSEANVGGVYIGSILQDCIVRNILIFDDRKSENLTIGNKGNSKSPITGASNTVVGFYALGVNDTGYDNTAMGVYALASNTSGTENTAIGYRAMQTNSTGIRNTALGKLAGTSNSTGSYNVFIGYNANESGNPSNAIAIGKNATVTSSNTMQIGGSGSDAVDVVISGGLTVNSSRTTYIPALTADVTSPTIGNGVLIGRRTPGKDVSIDIKFTFGSTSNAGTGTWNLDIPITKEDSVAANPNVIGHGFAYDLSDNKFHKFEAVAVSTTQFQMLFCDGTANRVDSGSPFAWATGDQLSIQLHYEAA